jgi:hypothetical protein
MRRTFLTASRTTLAALAVVAFGSLVPTAAEAQPFDQWLELAGHPGNGYVEVPHHPDLEPNAAFTFEAWVRIHATGNGNACRSIAGKKYLTAWWIGVCSFTSSSPKLRSYLRGNGSGQDGGTIPFDEWTHVAVVFDGAKRFHYINGEKAAEFAEPGGPLPGNAGPLRIGSDVDWAHSPPGEIEEVRLWRVARTMAQIRGSLDETITSAQPGLVAVWPLDGDADDALGSHDGSQVGGGMDFGNFPGLANCGAGDATTLCLADRFRITADWRTNPLPGSAPDGAAQVLPTGNEGSGIFTFFGVNNWEIMVKALDGCGLNDRYWIFSAATTNLYYRLDVTDVVGGKAKIYFNYPGPPAPAVTDTSAFATCDL